MAYKGIGLAQSYLCRLENEHMTALSMWEPAVMEKDLYSIAETSIIENDVEKLSKVINEGMLYINEQDSSGATLLHLSCSFLYQKARLEVTELLLDYPGIDLSLKNYCGNTAFHYFLQIPRENITRYKEILEKFVVDCAHLHIRNDNVGTFNLIP